MYSELTESNLSSEENEVSRPQSFKKKKKKDEKKRLHQEFETKELGNICLNPRAARHGDGGQEFVIDFIGMSVLWKDYQASYFFSDWETIVQFNTLKKALMVIYG